MTALVPRFRAITILGQLIALAGQLTERILVTQQCLPVAKQTVTGMNMTIIFAPRQPQIVQTASGTNTEIKFAVLHQLQMVQTATMTNTVIGMREIWDTWH